MERRQFRQPWPKSRLLINQQDTLSILAGSSFISTFTRHSKSFSPLDTRVALLDEIGSLYSLIDPMYLGCGTSGNRGQWTLFAALSLCCVVLWIVSKAERSKCQICEVHGDDVGNCSALYKWNDFDEATESAHATSLALASVPYCS